MTEQEISFIRSAEAFLENPGLLMRLTSSLGKRIEAAQERLPARANELITEATQKALHKALAVALKTIDTNQPRAHDHAESAAKAKATGRAHLAATAVTGGLGGFLGLLSLPIELPVTTTLMLRSIAEIAAEFGADLNRVEDRLECLMIFSLGSRSEADDAAESGYFASRIALSAMIERAAAFVATQSAREALLALEKGAAPSLIRFITSVASRFELTVTEKALAKAIPIIGIAGGAAINGIFTDHFNNAARYHFGLKKLEKTYGSERVRELYTQFQRERKDAEGNSKTEFRWA